MNDLGEHRGYAGVFDGKVLVSGLEPDIGGIDRTACREDAHFRRLAVRGPSFRAVSHGAKIAIGGKARSQLVAKLNSAFYARTQQNFGRAENAGRKENLRSACDLFFLRIVAPIEICDVVRRVDTVDGADLGFR